MPNSPSVDRASGRHRKSRTMSPALRRAAVIVVTAPVAGTILFGTSAFAAERTVATTATLDPAEQKIADNLDTRVQDVRLGSTFSGVVIDSQSRTAVWGHDASTALMPASNTKLATSTAALTILGPDQDRKSVV